MSQPLVIAHHLIWTAYGWWLPNDPRGSMSTVIVRDVIAELGELHYGRKKVQPASKVIRTFYENAAEILKHSLLTFDSTCVMEIAESFGETIRKHSYTCYACAIMPDHVHLVIRKHKHAAEEMIELLQNSSRPSVRATDHYDDEHPVWGGPGWKVFLDHPEEVWRTIRYVEENPIKAKLPAQRWAFVTPYDNWPLHVGHSANSPYAVRLKAAGKYPRNRR